jgi:hypothetical protein
MYKVSKGERISEEAGFVAASSVSLTLWVFEYVATTTPQGHTPWNVKAEKQKTPGIAIR